MTFRMISVATMTLAMLVAATTAVAKEKDANSHEGKLVSIKGDALVMTSKAGDEHSHALSSESHFTLDGKACKAADLKPGTRIRVTTRSGDKGMAIHVEGIDKHREFASNCHNGKVVSITGNQLVMTGTEGKIEQTCTLASDAKITCDGKVCKPADLKPSMRIRVTTEIDKPQTVIRVEALDKNSNFASP